MPRYQNIFFKPQHVYVVSLNIIYQLKFITSLKHRCHVHVKQCQLAFAHEGQHICIEGNLWMMGKKMARGEPNGCYASHND